MKWQALAACKDADPDLFFPPIFDGMNGSSRANITSEDDRLATAKSYCAICPVRRRCLDEALERGEKVGVWGGVDLQAPHKLRDRDRAAQMRTTKVRRGDARARREAVAADVAQIAEWRPRAERLTNTEGESA